MKIIFSPAKSQVIRSSPLALQNSILFPEKTKVLQKILHALSLTELMKVLKISEKKAKEVYMMYHDNSQKSPAISTFNGTSFKELHNEFNRKESLYMEKHLVILSALYGILGPFDLIQAYRLDMNDRLVLHGYKNLYDFWENTYVEFFKKEKCILNLASEEYAKLVSKKYQGIMINVHLVNEQKGIQKIIPVHAKKQRGKFMVYLKKKKTKKLNKKKNIFFKIKNIKKI